MDLVERSIEGMQFNEIKGDEDGPYILLFHGYGANKEDLVPLHRIYFERPRPTWIFPQGPLEVRFTEGYSGRAWFPINFTLIHEAIQQKNLSLLKEAFPLELSEARKFGKHLIAELHIPLSKLFLGGFSQGGVLALDLALSLQEHVAGLILLSAPLIHQEEWKKNLSLLSGTSYFISHGTNDPFFPLELIRTFDQSLREAGLKGNFFSFQGGHDIPFPVMMALGQFLKETLSPPK